MLICFNAMFVDSILFQHHFDHTFLIWYDQMALKSFSIILPACFFSSNLRDLRCLLCCSLPVEFLILVGQHAHIEINQVSPTFVDILAGMRFALDETAFIIVGGRVFGFFEHKNQCSFFRILKFSTRCFFSPNKLSQSTKNSVSVRQDISQANVRYVLDTKPFSALTQIFPLVFKRNFDVIHFVNSMQILPVLSFYEFLGNRARKCLSIWRYKVQIYGYSHSNYSLNCHRTDKKFQHFLDGCSKKQKLSSFDRTQRYLKRFHERLKKIMPKMKV